MEEVNSVTTENSKDSCKIVTSHSTNSIKVIVLFMWMCADELFFFYLLDLFFYLLYLNCGVFFLFQKKLFLLLFVFRNNFFCLHRNIPMVTDMHSSNSNNNSIVTLKVVMFHQHQAMIVARGIHVQLHTGLHLIGDQLKEWVSWPFFDRQHKRLLAKKVFLVFEENLLFTKTCLVLIKVWKTFFSKYFLVRVATLYQIIWN